MKTNGPSDYEPPMNSKKNNGSNKPNNIPSFNHSGNNNHGSRKPNSGIPGFKGPVKKSHNSVPKQNNKPNIPINNNDNYYNKMNQDNKKNINNPNQYYNNFNNNNNIKSNAPIDNDKYSDGYKPNKFKPGFKKSSNDKGPKKFLSKKNLFLFLKIALILFIIGSLATAGVIYSAISSYNKSDLKLSDDQLALDNLTTSIYDENDELVQKLTNSANTDFVSIDQIPKDLQNAFIALEDERFYEHNGFDAWGFTRGMITTVLGKRSGGSTLTMQLVKNITAENEASYKRKIIEIYRAMNIEKRLSKRKILEKYLNVIYMGTDSEDKDNAAVSIYGVKAAAIRFFEKDISEGDELTLTECAVIAGITQNPLYYMPKNEENQENIVDKAKNTILAKMLDQEYIDEAEYENALAEKVEFKKGNLNYASSTDQSYFLDAVLYQAAEEISEETGVSKKEAQSGLYTKGYKIYTTLNRSIQEKMDKVFLDEKKYFGNTLGQQYEGADYNPQAGMVILDPETGYVQALYGGRGEKTTAMSSNYATGHGMSNGGRGPGSSFKPVSVYAPALENGTITPGTVIDDVPVYYLGSNSTERYPKNSSSNTHYGMITARRALAMSNNVVVAKLFYQLDQSYIIDTLEKLQLFDKKNNDSNLDLNTPFGQSITATPLSMAAAYATFENGGIYNSPSTYTKIVDSNNQTIIDKTKTEDTQTVVFSEQTSYLLTDMLKDVLETEEGTANGYGITNKKGNKIPSAGKTGTTSNSVDRWFVGYTPYYVGAVWYGDINSYPLTAASSKDHVKIWNAVMESVHEDLEPTDFKKPDGIKEVNLCKYSGSLPSELCSDDPQGNAIQSEIVNEKYTPSSKCKVHVKNTYCTDAYNKYKKYYEAGANCTNVFTKVLRQRDEALEGVHDSHLNLILDIAYTSFSNECPLHGGGTYTGDTDESESPSESPTDSDETKTPKPSESDTSELPTVTITSDITEDPTELPTIEPTGLPTETENQRENNGNN